MQKPLLCYYILMKVGGEGVSAETFALLLHFDEGGGGGGRRGLNAETFVPLLHFEGGGGGAGGRRG